jgi:hypothetical protein
MWHGMNEKSSLIRLIVVALLKSIFSVPSLHGKARIPYINKG